MTATDEHTLTVLDELALKGFQVLHQHNQGLGATRNNGIGIAKGKYILPLDGQFRLEALSVLNGEDIL